MWARFAQHITPNTVRYIGLPIATVVGTIGYFIERKLSKPKKIEILETSLIDQRNKRRSKALLEDGMKENDNKSIVPDTLSINS
uniref:ATP synthase subunit e, mitochondrial n=1 Tax=Strongyloides stercoralis TaxID=6248 RepID=A0A0K0DUA5_STRER